LHKHTADKLGDINQKRYHLSDHSFSDAVSIGLAIDGQPQFADSVSAIFAHINTRTSKPFHGAKLGG